MQKNLGEVWIPGEDSEVTYGGETGESATSMQYYRNKIREFQETMNRADEVSRIAMEVIDMDADASLSADLSAMLDEFESKKFLMKATAETINAGAAVINAAGGRMPQLSIPSTLGFLPALPLAAVAAIGVAASLVVWGNTWISGVSERMKIAMVSDPVKRDALIAKTAEIDAAARASSGSGLSNIAGIVKWGALAFGLWLAYQAFSEHQKTRGA